MDKNVVPMIHVPDARATVDWYESNGFKVIATYGNEGDGFEFCHGLVWKGRSDVQPGWRDELEAPARS